MPTLVLTAIGDDQSGLVDALSGVIASHGASWDQSHMSHLAGKFAGIVQISVPEGRVDDLLAALEPLEHQGLLDITASKAPNDTAGSGARPMRLELVGQDRVGIIHDLSHALAELGVSIHELQTATASAPMGGGTLFEASALLEVPADVDQAALRDTVEQLSNELMVDIDLDADGPA
ncbi:MAG: ACT domain-containing protein [Actinomycetota bacterium]